MTKGFSKINLRIFCSTNKAVDKVILLFNLPQTIIPYRAYNRAYISYIEEFNKKIKYLDIVFCYQILSRTYKV